MDSLVFFFLLFFSFLAKAVVINSRWINAAEHARILFWGGWILPELSCAVFRGDRRSE